MMWFDKLFFAGVALFGVGSVMSIIAFSAMLMHTRTFKH